MKMIKMTITNRKSGGRTVEVSPKRPAGKVHVYLGVCGYKLSVGERHLTLAELAWICEKINQTT